MYPCAVDDHLIAVGATSRRVGVVAFRDISRGGGGNCACDGDGDQEVELHVHEEVMVWKSCGGDVSGARTVRKKKVPYCESCCAVSEFWNKTVCRVQGGQQSFFPFAI